MYPRWWRSRATLTSKARPAGRRRTPRNTWSQALALASIALLAACGGDDPPAPDTIPPSAIRDLRVTAVSSSTVRLQWTAPGDDGAAGTATNYDLRASETLFNAGSFDTAPRMTPTPEPQESGAAETFSLTDRKGSTTYFLALKAIDDAGHAGGMSNLVSLTMPEDKVAPGAITDLRLTATGAASLTLEWTAPGDDGASGRSWSYIVGRSNRPITAGTWPQATKFTLPDRPLIPGSPEHFEWTGLPSSTVMYVMVVSRDESSNEAALSNMVNGRTLPPPRVWVIKADGTGAAPTIQAGIDAAAEGDTVLVMRGRYYENLNFKGKDLILLSAEGPEATILDGSRVQPAPVILCNSGETNSAVIEGFTITGGTGYHEGGGTTVGGGLCAYDSAPTLCRNVFEENAALRYGRGGGFYYRALLTRPDFAVIVFNNVVRNNRSEMGAGGFAIIAHRTEFVGNQIESNSCQGDGGGGIIGVMGGPARIVNNTFISNWAWDHGGGLTIDGDSPESFLCRDNLFVRNKATGAGLGDTGSGGGLLVWDCGGTIENNTFVGNEGTDATRCGNGGAIGLFRTLAPFTISRNVIAFNGGGGVSFRESPPLIVESNLFWQNWIDSTHVELCPDLWPTQSVIADPHFCDPDNLDFRVAANSPAITGEEVIGAYGTPGCPARTSPASIWVQSTNWSHFRIPR